MFNASGWLLIFNGILGKMISVLISIYLIVLMGSFHVLNCVIILKSYLTCIFNEQPLVMFPLTIAMFPCSIILI